MYYTVFWWRWKDNKWEYVKKNLPNNWKIYISVNFFFFLPKIMLIPGG